MTTTGWRRVVAMVGGLALALPAVSEGVLCRHKKTGALRVRTECNKKFVPATAADLGLGVAAGGGLALDGSDLSLAPGGVGTDALAAAAVTSAKLAAGAVGPDALGIVPAARVHHSGNQSVPGNAASTILTFDSERFDTAALHDPAANASRLTAPIAGVYLVTANILWEADNGGVREMGINKNDSTIVVRDVVDPGIDPNSTEQAIATLAQLDAGDFLEVKLRQNSGSALNVVAAPEFSPEFAMMWLGPAPTP